MRVPNSRKTETAFWVRVLKAFCSKSGGIPLDLSTCSPSELNYVLCRFYIAVRHKNGRPSYPAARAASSRHVLVDLNKPELNLFLEAVFRRSNHVLDRHLNEPAVEHKLSGSDEDFERLKVYFDDVLDSPVDAVKLSFFSWYNLTLKCAFRSSEVQVALKKEDIIFANDAERGTNATIWRDFLSKNYRESTMVETLVRVRNLWTYSRSMEARCLQYQPFGNRRARSASTEEKGEQAQAETEASQVTPLLNTVFSVFWAVSFQKKCFFSCRGFIVC